MRVLSLGSTGWGALAVLVGALMASHCAASGADPQGSPAEGTNPTEAQPEPDTTLQESDIYKRDGNRLYVLNRFRGLMVADLTRVDEPALVSRLALPATPREMWFGDHHAFILTSSVTHYGFGWWQPANTVDVDLWATYRGSSLALVDVADAQAPRLDALLPLGGDCFDGRLRGQILYLGCTGSAQMQGDADTHVYAVDVSNPALPSIISQVDIPAGTSPHHLYVAQERMYLGRATNTGSEVHVVDISSLAGEVRLRGHVEVSATLLDRFGMDEWEGHLRVATGNTTANGDAHITTFDMANPDAPVQVSEVHLRVAERFTSARFDGARGYVVTVREVAQRAHDPLFVFDLSNPAEPRNLGELQLSGWLDHLVPMGDRLFAMGHDDVSSGRTLAVSMFDVSGEPRLLSRIPLAGAWGTIPAERDDYNKVFRVFSELGMVIFPYRTFATGTWSTDAGMLLLDFDRDTLTQRADLQDLGLVERGLLWNATTLVTLSAQSLQTFDVTGSVVPQRLGYLELASQTRDFVRLENGTLVELVGDLHGSPARLRAWDPLNMGQAPLSSLELDDGGGYVLANGNLVYFVNVDRFSAFAQSPVPTTVTAVDFSDPTLPVLRSSLSLGRNMLASANHLRSFQNRHVVMPAPGVLVLMGSSNYAYQGCSDGRSTTTLLVVDVRNPDAPREVKELQSDVYLPRLEAGNNRVFLLGYGVQVLDVSQVDNPQLSKVMRDDMVAMAADAATGRVVLRASDFQRPAFPASPFGEYAFSTLLTEFDGDSLEEKNRIPADSYGWNAQGILRGNHLVMTEVRLNSATQIYESAIQHHTLNGNSLTRNPDLAGAGATLELVSLEQNHLTFISSSSGTVHVVNLDAAGGAAQVLVAPMAGEGGTTAVVDDALIVAGGYQGLIHHVLAP